jgi:hypothetical protein
MARSNSLDPPRSINRIKFPPSAELIVLLLELEPDSGFQSYRATLSTAAGESLWSGNQMQPSSREMLTLTFNTTLFKAGDCRLMLEGLTAQGQYISIAQYSFRVLAQ